MTKKSQCADGDKFSSVSFEHVIWITGGRRTGGGKRDSHNDAEFGDTPRAPQPKKRNHCLRNASKKRRCKDCMSRVENHVLRHYYNPVRCRKITQKLSTAIKMMQMLFSVIVEAPFTILPCSEMRISCQFQRLELHHSAEAKLMPDQMCAL